MELNGNHLFTKTAYILLVFNIIKIDRIFGYGTFSVSNAVGGVQFSNDITIGTSTLYNDGERLYSDGHGYQITLLAVEGAFTAYSLVDGFLLGYQWYWKGSTEDISIQLYYLDSIDPRETYAGNYTLVSNTGFISSVEGLNSHYIAGGIAIDSSDSTNDAYVIAIMSPALSAIAVLADYCTGDGKVILQATLASQPLIGDTINFPASVTQSCNSFSLQGIYMPTVFAHSDSGCSVYVAQTEINLYSTDLDNSESSVCWIIRAASENERLKIESTSFTLIATPSCSETVSVFEFADPYSGYDPNLIGTYCGTDFGEEAKWTSQPYIKVDFTKTSPTVRGYFHIRVTSYAPEQEGGGLSTTAKVGIGVGSGSAVLILVCMKAKHDKKKKQAVAQEAEAKAAKEKAEADKKKKDNAEGLNKDKDNHGDKDKDKNIESSTILVNGKTTGQAIASNTQTEPVLPLELRPPPMNPNAPPPVDTQPIQHQQPIIPPMQHPLSIASPIKHQPGFLPPMQHQQYPPQQQQQYPPRQQSHQFYPNTPEYPPPSDPPPAYSVVSGGVSANVPGTTYNSIYQTSSETLGAENNVIEVQPLAPPHAALYIDT